MFTSNVARQTNRAKCMCKYSHVKPESKRKECALAVYTNDAINIQFQSCASLLLSISRLNHKFATIKIWFRHVCMMSNWNFCCFELWDWVLKWILKKNTRINHFIWYILSKLYLFTQFGVVDKFSSEIEKKNVVAQFLLLFFYLLSFIYFQVLVCLLSHIHFAFWILPLANMIDRDANTLLFGFCFACMLFLAFN